ncbi:TetR/AcrR family transcriptional regulator [Amycolatopsis endophytica]
MAEQRTLVLAAASHVFATNGVQGSTIEQIAREAGLTRQAVYELYGDKNAIFEAVVAQAEEDAYAAIAAAGASDAELDLKSWARKNYATLFEFVASHPDALALFQEAERAGNQALSRLRQRLARVYTDASGQRWAAFGVEPGRADTALVTMYFAMVESLVRLNWDGDPPDRDALLDLLTEFTIGGVLRLYSQAPEVIARVR